MSTITRKPNANRLMARKVGAASVQQLLCMIGFAERSIYRPKRDSYVAPKNNETFWERHEHDLDGWLSDAHRKYKEAIKLAHPDAGGSIERATLVNQAWSRIKHLFRLHGATL